MILPRSATAGMAGRATTLKGSFALEPVDALPRLAEAVTRLADRAVEGNPFFLPEFLAPAIQAFGPRGLKLAVVFDREDLRFFAPVVAGSFLLGGSQLRVWTHPYAPLGSPLLDSGCARQVAEALLAHLKASGRSLIALPDLPLDGPLARALKGAAKRQGFATEAERRMRPILHAGPEASRFEELVSQKRRRELDRQLRRLADTGPVSLLSAQSPTELDAAFALFSDLEASGWKGHRGSALGRKRVAHDFARTAILELGRSGRAAIDVMRVGERPVAALIRLTQGSLSVPWKIAYDEEFAAFSPGKQLICDETRRWLADPAIGRVDPVCEEGNALMAPLWKEREPYGTLLVSPRRRSMAARLTASLLDFKTHARHRAKRLLGRAKPIAAVAPAAR
jgi:CelD/BcsL family acetyltransferase involved in cellulose biosynthesis